MKVNNPLILSEFYQLKNYYINTKMTLKFFEDVILLEDTLNIKIEIGYKKDGESEIINLIELL